MSSSWPGTLKRVQPLQATETFRLANPIRICRAADNATVGEDRF